MKHFIVMLMWAVTMKCAAIHLSDYINTSIGVIDKRWNNYVIDPRVPYSSISTSSQTPKGVMDGLNSQQLIIGFCQLHVSGTGWSSCGTFSSFSPSEYGG